MKKLLRSRMKWAIAATATLAGLLIGGYAAVLTDRSSQSIGQPASMALTPSVWPLPTGQFEDEHDPATRRDFLDHFSGVGPDGVSPENFAKAWARARALPLSPLLSGQRFDQAQQTTTDTGSTSWTSVIQPPVVGPPPWNNDANSSRIDAFGLDPSNSNIIYAGGSGGLLKSTDAGNHWQFLSDNWESQAVTSISVDRSAPNNVYVGTGSFAYGVGLYRSTDSGSSWTLLVGNCPTCPPNTLPIFVQTSIRRVAVDSPLSGTVIYVVTGASGTHSSEIWKSTDAGVTWGQVPHPGPTSEVRDMAIDYLASPSHLYAGTDTGVYKSTDGGQSWNNLNWNTGIISIAVVQSVPYLLASNGGANKLYYYAAGTWTEIRTICPSGVEPAVCSSVGAPINPWDFAVDPSDANIILVGTNGFFRTTNATAGPNATWQDIRPQINFRDLHFDQRALAFSETVPGLAYVGNDGGIWRTTTHGSLNNWDNLNQNLPGSLLYSVGLSNDGSMISGTQDNGAVFSYAGGPWNIILGGDAYQSFIEPNNNGEFSYYISNGGGGSFRRHIKSTGADSDISPPGSCRTWSMNPLAPERLTAACVPVARTTNATLSTVSWQAIGATASPAPSNVTAAREAPNNSNVIYAVQGNQVVWVTTNANAGAPPGSAATWAQRYTSSSGINNICIDPTNPNVAYLACNNAVHKTTDMGLTWTVRGISDLVYRDLVIDPSAPNQIIAATNAGVMASIDAGETWGYMSVGIPTGMIVTGLSFNNTTRKVAASTYGRGAYVLTVSAPLPLVTPTPFPTPSPTPSPTPTPTPHIPVTVSLPVATISTAILNFTQAVSTSAIDFSQDLISFQADILFDSTVIGFQSQPVTAAGLTANNWNIGGLVVAGSGPIRTLRLSGTSNDFTPLSGSGTLFNLNMVRASNTPGASSSLVFPAPPYDFVFFDSNLEEHTPDTLSGKITIAATANVSGAISYCSNPSLAPVSAVTLTLAGSAGGSTSSDASGNYLFPSLTSGGNYTVTPSKAALPPGFASINTIDVIAVQRHFLTIGTPLSGCRLTAADVNGVNGVNTVDVIAIQRFFLSLTSGLANTGKYQFIPVNRSYTPLTTNQTGQNYDGLIFGDVASPFVH